MEEHRPACAAAVVDRGARARVSLAEVAAVRCEVVESRALPKRAFDVVGGCVHRDAEPVVFAHEQNGAGLAVQDRRGRRGEARLRGGVVDRRVTERAIDDRVGGHGGLEPETVHATQGERESHRLRQMASDGAGLRWHHQAFASEHFVPPARDRILGGRDQRKHRVEDRCLAAPDARARRHESSRPVVQERGIGHAQQMSEHRVRLVAAAADRVEASALVLEASPFQVLQPRLESGFQQCHRGPSRERRVRVDGRVGRPDPGRVGARVVVDQAFEPSGNELFAAHGAVVRSAQPTRKRGANSTAEHAMLEEKRARSVRGDRSSAQSSRASAATTAIKRMSCMEPMVGQRNAPSSPMHAGLTESRALPQMELGDRGPLKRVDGCAE